VLGTLRFVAVSCSAKKNIESPPPKRYISEIQRTNTKWGSSIGLETASCQRDSILSEGTTWTKLAVPWASGKVCVHQGHRGAESAERPAVGYSLREGSRSSAGGNVVNQSPQRNLETKEE